MSKKKAQASSDEIKTQKLEIAETYAEAKERSHKMDMQVRKLNQNRPMPRFSRPQKAVEQEVERQSGPNLRAARLERDSQLDIERHESLREVDREIKKDHLPASQAALQPDKIDAGRKKQQTAEQKKNRQKKRAKDRGKKQDRSHHARDIE